MPDDVKTSARGRWPAILTRLGIDADYLTGRPGPCPICRAGTDRWTFDDQNGDGDWFCRQCTPQAGDGFALLERVNGWDFQRAIEEVRVAINGAAARPAKPPADPARMEIPVPADAPPMPATHPTMGDPPMRWTYRDVDGRLLFVVARWEIKERKIYATLALLTGLEAVGDTTPAGKPLPAGWLRTHETRARYVCHLRDGSGWGWGGGLGKGQRRPLYGLPALADGRPVLLVEGEKAADAAAGLFPDFAVIGYGTAVKQLDLDPLAGRQVTIWPDADAPGRDAAGKLAKALPDARIVTLPGDLPQGWDLADDAGGRDLRRILDAAPDRVEIPDRIYDEAPPFRSLGFDGQTYYYLPEWTRQVTAISAGNHQKRHLLQLAPLAWWVSAFPGERGVDWDAAADHLLNSLQCRVYDPTRIRGRGCWWDDDRPVLHLGDRLMVAGAHVEIGEFPSAYVYSGGTAMPEPGDPLDDAAAAEIAGIARRFSWEHSASAALLLGWLVLAPICGALRWRPHIWITTEGGGGKSTILDQFLGPLLAGYALPVQGATTEAGLRQSLRMDALPVLFDEADATDERGRIRMQHVLELARQSSSEGLTSVRKGSASGLAQTYLVRSMFAFFSVNASAREQADHTRISVLPLRGATTASSAAWPALAAALAEHCTPETGRRLLARTLDRVDEIRANAEQLARAGATLWGYRRLGDQYGALLAGAASLASPGRMTADQARRFLESFDFGPYIETAMVRDDGRCLGRIMQHQVRCDGAARAETRTLGELIADSRSGSNPNIPQELADEILGRHGLRIMGDGVLIANRAEALRRVLHDTPWTDSWPAVLRRLDGAETAQPTRFAPGLMSRATRVPLSAVLG